MMEISACLLIATVAGVGVLGVFVMVLVGARSLAVPSDRPTEVATRRLLGVYVHNQSRDTHGCACKRGR